MAQSQRHLRSVNKELLGERAGWLSFGASYFTGRNPLKKSQGQAWSGFQLNWSPGMPAKKQSGKFSNTLDKLKKVNSKTAGLNFSQSYYYMLYGNGSDELNNREDVSGWNFFNPIDPEDNR